ncbi:MAG: Xaa-Pro peptidase family protein, partial [Alphaproteobacteria bacterium]|nr:Xaa-Pro peptidase family protein [Alphaproteobacteria bacterium]
SPHSPMSATPEFPDFPKEEFEQRYSRARSLMSEHNIDALLVTEKLNYGYLSGHRSCQNPIDKIRSYMLILPKDSDPTLITMPFEVAQVEQTTYISDIRTIGGLTGHPDFITDTLKSLGLQNARIGAELGREQYLGTNYLALQEIMNNLPGAEFVDASPVLLNLRVVKSPREIEYIRRAAQISAQSQKEIFAEVRAGMTENEIATKLRTRLFEKGAEDLTLLCVVSGATPSTGITLLPTDRVVKKGETLGFDVGVTYRGYCCDNARTASVGKPSEELAEFYDWMMTLRYECDSKLRVGSAPRDVIAVVDKHLQQRGLKTMGVGRVGHGVGVETTEYPSLAAFEEVPFQKGMVFACNPNFANHLGFLNAEDNWAITDDEPDLLTDPIATPELLIVSD